MIENPWWRHPFHPLYKPAAVDADVTVVKANRPRQLVIHRADGAIEGECTYGKDSFPPRG